MFNAVCTECSNLAAKTADCNSKRGIVVDLIGHTRDLLHIRDVLMSPSLLIQRMYTQQP